PIRPLMPSPGNPNTVSTPQATSRRATASPTVDSTDTSTDFLTGSAAEPSEWIQPSQAPLRAGRRLRVTSLPLTSEPPLRPTRAAGLTAGAFRQGRGRVIPR